MRPRVRIAEPEGFSSNALSRLREVAEVSLAPCRPEDLAQVLRDVDVFWFRLGHRIDGAVLPEDTRPRIIATPVTGLDAGAVLESDRVNPKKFYALVGGRFFVSTDGGRSFAATVSDGLPSDARVHAVPGHEGEIWLVGSTGMFRSTDSGTSFATPSLRLK